MRRPQSVPVLRRLVKVSPPPKGRLAGAVVLGVAASAATIGLLAGSGALVDKAAVRPGLGAIAGLLAVVEVIAFARAPLRYAERLVAHDAGFRALAGWRLWLFDRLEPLSPAPLSKWRASDVMGRALGDVDALQDLYLRGVSPVVQAVLVGAIGVAVEGVLVPWAALVLGSALVVAMAGSWTLPWMARRRDHEVEQAAELDADVVDLVRGAAELLALGGVDEQLRRVEACGEGLRVAAARQARARGIASMLTWICAAGAVAGTLATAVAAVTEGRLEPLMLAVVPFTALGTFEVVPLLGAAAAGAAHVVSAGQRLLDLQALAPVIGEPPEPARAPSAPISVALTDVRLRYDELGPWALDGLTMRLQSGTSTVIIGPSGSGKTSIINALMRFWPLDSGSTEAGGVALETLTTDATRSLFAITGSDAHLFTGTLEDNLRLGRPAASDAEIDSAIGRAQLAEWIAALPHGLGTEVGEGGAMLSGGERQRVALARALIAARPVLLADEPTDALDSDMAARAMRSLTEADPARTVLVITQRPQGVAKAQRVVRLERGHLVENAKKGSDQGSSEGAKL
ncbi:MAG: thiol reductant ABC exporter subunit CydC [Acidimicrobiales bacterium]